MALDLASSTAVITARQFNPSITREHWLIANGILQADDLRPGCVFTDMLVQVASREFNLLLAPQHCQFKPLVPLQEQQHLIRDKVGTIIRALPHTPYTAMGLNFHWHLLPENTSVEELSRRLFFVPGGPLHTALDVPDARFGGYVSTDFRLFRMKMDVKPIIKMENSAQQHLLQLAFNFNIDLQSNRAVQAIEEALEQWEHAREESSRISQLAAAVDVI